MAPLAAAPLAAWGAPPSRKSCIHARATRVAGSHPPRYVTARSVTARDVLRESGLTLVMVAFNLGQVAELLA